MQHVRLEPAAPTVLSALRDATAGEHAAVERVPRLAALLDPGLTLSAYADTLARYHRHFARHESGIAACLAPRVSAAVLERRRRLPLLAADLHALGRAAPAMAPAPRPASVVAAAGWFYVHEGAALGGRVILRAVRRSLGDTLGGASRFLSLEGQDTAALWQESRAILALLLQDDAALAAAIGGAKAAFAEITRCMTEPDAVRDP